MVDRIRLPDLPSAGTFGRVAVLCGGLSAEREISLQSGQRVYDALMELGVSVEMVDADNTVVAQLQSGGFNRVFNVLHGPRGEDGAMMGALEILNIPYTGCGVLGAALAMDKARSKQLWRANNIPTPDFIVIDPEKDLVQQVAHLRYPMAIKPTYDGSSLGVSKVYRADDLADAVALAAKYGQVMAESWVEGAEYTVSILYDFALPTIRIEPVDHEFYDYDAKYISEITEYICPSDLGFDQESFIRDLCERAFHVIGCQDWGRVDFIVDKEGRPWMIEINPIPGMTSHSLFPIAAQAIGLSFPEACLHVLATSFRRELVMVGAQTKIANA